MELHDDPGRMLLRFREQHELVLGELHGDMVARASETDMRFEDQGEPRRIVRSASLLETVLKSRERRQTKESTLQARGSYGFSMVLEDGHGTVVRTKLFPRGDDGERLKPVPYIPGRQPIRRPDEQQLSFEDEFGEPFGVDDPMVPPPGFGFYVLWWPGSLGLGGAELAAGWVKNKMEPVLYATLPLPDAIMEVRDASSAAPGVAPTPLVAVSTTGKGKKPRRMDDDFDSVVGPEEAAPPQSPS